MTGSKTEETTPISSSRATAKIKMRNTAQNLVQSQRGKAESKSGIRTRKHKT
jgi:hypothetical protein